jgi:apolipoprotein N-acyltransferase
LVLAFAPFGFGLLALPDLAALFYLLRRAETSGAATATGYAFGLGLLGFGVFWLRISINQFGGVPPPLAVAFTLLFILLIAIYFALMAWLAHRLGKGCGEACFMLLVAPSTWLSIELLRAYLFTGFPWLSIGYTQIDLPLAGYAPLFGVFGVGLLLALSAGLLNLWRRRWAVPLLAALWAAGYGLSWMTWTQPAGEAFLVALVQGNVPQSDKWRPSFFEPTLRLYRKLSDQAAAARLVIWPETAIPSFDAEVEESLLRPLHEQMRQQGRDLLTGIVSGEPDGRYYNAMLALGVSGRHAYLKRHLVPFGEYLPLAFMLDPVLGFLDIPMSDFSAGNGQARPVKLAGHWAGIDICYEDAFGNEVAASLPKAGFLINASNDAWFGDSLAPHQHLQIARMRALETGRYLLRATNTGISAIIAPDGSLRQTAPQFRQAVLSGDIVPMQGMTPYAYWRDAPMVALALSASFGLWATRYRRRAIEVGVA